MHNGSQPSQQRAGAPDVTAQWHGRRGPPLTLTVAAVSLLTQLWFWGPLEPGLGRFTLGAAGSGKLWPQRSRPGSLLRLCPRVPKGVISGRRFPRRPLPESLAWPPSRSTACAWASAHGREAPAGLGSVASPDTASGPHTAVRWSAAPPSPHRIRGQRTRTQS